MSTDSVAEQAPAGWTRFTGRRIHKSIPFIGMQPAAGRMGFSVGAVALLDGASHVALFTNGSTRLFGLRPLRADESRNYSLLISKNGQVTVNCMPFMRALGITAPCRYQHTDTIDGMLVFTRVAEATS